ncbi:DNA polymerase LigD, polymerase domain protein [Kribbella flavida DSM 17836]|uniref:DNA polymerase LigD, polymerase domain protein n=1 Tax=Kribbella flavida (strain DSM 17836 / JCM 10339 / NBRC 14399) TaxID=479435 RepID=D2PWA4_KRIFD|nr:non-homologous end-joining DNA ligase [Kribbella flavida]ADB31556.1 DNA polymerase LigD, polymerase domain protein [Kribbella flavida DSM 17836]
MASKPDETRDGVDLTNLDQPLFDGAEATKRDLVDYLDAVHERLLPELRERPLSVIRVRPGQQPFMQKNVPKYTPDWVKTVTVWAEASKREVSYALCDDRRTLLWFANQRAVEYHPTLMRAERWDRVTHLVLDLDPPEGETFRMAVQAAQLVRQALTDSGLAGAVKTSGAKGVHVYVPIDDKVSIEDAAAATRAIAARAERIDPAVATTAYIKEDREGKVFVDSTRSGGATVVAAYSPRIRPGTPVSFPVGWDELDNVSPADFTLRSVPGLLATADRWSAELPAPQTLPEDLLEEGRAIPIARVVAMHEGKRRARAKRAAEEQK